MTTEAQLEQGRKQQRREIAAEFKRNRIFWQEHAAELRKQHPTARLLILDGGTVLAFDDSQEYFDYLFSLDDFRQATVFHVLPPRKRGTFRIRRISFVADHETD